VWGTLNDVACARILHFRDSDSLEVGNHADNLWLSEELYPLSLMNASTYDVIKLWISLHLFTEGKEASYEILSFFAVKYCVHRVRSSTLRMEVAGSSESLLLLYQTAQSCIPENQNLHTVFTQILGDPSSQRVSSGKYVYRPSSTFSTVIGLWSGNEFFHMFG
jgi:hypothetical protein